MNHIIWELWHAHPRESGVGMPKFVLHRSAPEVGEHRARLLFIGLNPSAPKRLPSAFKAHIAERLQLRYPQDFSWDRSALSNAFDEEVAARYAKVHRDARYFYPRWFKNLNRVAEALLVPTVQTDTGLTILDFDHVDLFLPSDAKFTCLPRPYHEPCNWLFDVNSPTFVQRQLDIAFRLIAQYHPTLVVAVYMEAGKRLLAYANSREGFEGKLERLPGEHDICRADLPVLGGRTVPLFACQNLPKASDSYLESFIAMLPPLGHD